MESIQESPNKKDHASDQNGKEEVSLPVSSMPNSNEQEVAASLDPDHGGLPAEPEAQVMERATNSATTSSDAYRIPASVFTRDKSAGPTDWSVNSNDSLFSIHMGNMSFTKDAMFLKSGEFGFTYDPADFSTDNKSKPTDGNGGATQAQVDAAQVKDEDIKEIQKDHSKGSMDFIKDTHHGTTHSRTSDASGASVKSFAFPVLTGDINKSDSLNGGPGKQIKQPESQPGTPKSLPKTPKMQTPKASSNSSEPPKWLSCLPCCSSFISRPK